MANEPKPPLPKIGDIAAPPPDTPQPDADNSQRLMIAHVIRLDLPLEVDLSEAWAQTSHANMAASEVDAWLANGLRVGIVSAANLRKLTDTVSPTLGTSVLRITTGEQPAPMALTPTIRQPVHIDLTLPPDKPRRTPLPPGRSQFLLSLSPGSVADSASVRLMPHHYAPKATVQVRQPSEKALDGRVFNELPLATTLRRDQVLVIGLTPLLAIAPATTDDPSADANSEPNDQPEPEPPPKTPAPARRMGLESLPPQLGTLLLAAARGRRPVQMLILVRVTAKPGQSVGQGSPCLD